MRINKSQNAVRSIGWGTIHKISSIALPFVCRTVLIKVLGEQYLGLNSLFSSILQMLSLTELGFSSAIVYCMYKAVADDNIELQGAYLNFFKKVYKIIGLIILVIGLALIPALPNLINGTYPSDIRIDIVYVVYLLNTTCSYFLFAYKSAILSAYQRNDIESRVTLVVSTSLNILQIIILFVLRNFYAYIILLPISTIALNLYRNYQVNKYFPQIVIRGTLSKESIREIGRKVIALIGHKIGLVVLNAADNIVISAFIGLSAVAIYGNYNYVSTSITSIISVVYVSITAGIGNALITDSTEKNKETFGTLSFMNYWMVSWCSICLMCLYQPFMKIWTGKELMLPISTVILIVANFYILNIRKIVLSYKDAAGMWGKDVLKPYCEAGCNMILNLILVKFIGLNGVILASILAMGLISLPWETYVMYKFCFRQSFVHYMLDLLFKTIVLIIVTAVVYKICSLIDINPWINLIARGCICCLVPNAMFCLIYMKKREFTSSKTFAVRLVNKVLKKGV